MIGPMRWIYRLSWDYKDSEGSNITLKVTPTVYIWILCTVILRQTAWNNMHLYRTVRKIIAYLFNCLYLLSNCFDMESFQGTLAERYNMLSLWWNSIHLLYIVLNLWSKGVNNIGCEWFNQGFILEVKIWQWCLNYCHSSFGPVIFFPSILHSVTSR